MHRRALPRSRKNPGRYDVRQLTGRFRRTLFASSQSGLILLCVFSLIGLNLLFAVREPMYFWLVPVCLPFVAILAATVYYFSELLWRFQLRTATAVGRVNASFLSFFFYLSAMVILYFILLVVPMGYLLRSFTDGSLALDYRRWSLDLAAIQSLAIWVWSVFRAG